MSGIAKQLDRLLEVHTLKAAYTSSLRPHTLVAKQLDRLLEVPA